MKKNYFFGKAIAAMAILFGVSMGLVSCGNADDPIEEIVTPETPVTFTVTKTSGTTATTVILTPGNITDALKEVLADLVDAADAGETYTLTIDCSNLTINDTKITVPKVDGANLVLKFENVPSSDNPLQFEPKSLDGEGEPSVVPTSVLTIIMPDAASLDLNINLPETHVNLEGGYGTVAAVTSLGTLEVKDGAVVNFLNWLGGSVIVDEGGEIKGLVLTTDQIALDFISFNPFLDEDDNLVDYGFSHYMDISGEWTEWVNFVRKNTEDNFPYAIKKVKIIKGKYTDVAKVACQFGTGYEDDGNYISLPVEEMIIGEGVKVVMGDNPAINKITFEDNSSTHEILYGNVDYDIAADDEGNVESIEAKFVGQPELQLLHIKGFSNVTFKPANTQFTDDEDNVIIANPQIKNIPYGTENCKFIANIVNWNSFEGYNFSDGINVKNCSFELSNEYETEDVWDLPNIAIFYPEFSADFKSMPVKFDGCTFDSALKFNVNQFVGDAFPEGTAINYIFTDCTYGDEAFKKTGFYKEFGGLPENVKIYVKIDDNQYRFASVDGVMTLIPNE